MNRFTLTNALTPAAALEALRPDTAPGGKEKPLDFARLNARRPLAGGSDLLGEIKEGIISPELVVNLKPIAAWRGIEHTPDGGWRIGATTLIADVAAHDWLPSHCGALADAAEHVGSPQIRNQGTVGGNLCQRPRCWYYRHGDTVCLKKGGKACLAKEGENKYLAVFATDAPCVMASQTNLGAALLAVGGIVHVHGEAGERDVPADEFYRLPTADDPYRETNLAPGEVVAAISVRRDDGRRSAYLQMSEKADFDWALVSAATAVWTANDGTVRDIRLVLNAVAPMPWRLTKAEDFLRGKRADQATLREAAALALEDAKPLGHNAYKVAVAKALVPRVIVRALTGKS